MNKTYHLGWMTRNLRTWEILVTQEGFMAVYHAANVVLWADTALEIAKRIEDWC